MQVCTHRMESFEKEMMIKMDKKEYNELLEWDEKLNRETEEYIKKLYGEKTRVIGVRYKNHKNGGFVKIDLFHNDGCKRVYCDVVNMTIKSIDESLIEVESEIGYCHENCYHYDTDGEDGHIFCCNNESINDLPDKIVEKITDLEMRCPFWAGNYDYCRKHNIIHPSRVVCVYCMEENVKEMGNKKEYPEIIDIHKLVGYKQELKDKVVYGRMGDKKTHFKFKDKSEKE